MRDSYLIESFPGLNRLMLIGIVAGLAIGSGCEKSGATSEKAEDTHAPGEAAAPTNRVEIPAAVRQNLGITFAKVESRNVAQTLRLPGRFELLPTARREYRTPLAGRVELLVNQFDKVEAGTPLYRVDAPAWRDLHEQITAVQARVDSMGPLRDAQHAQEQTQAEKVALWQSRLKQLDDLRLAGGGSVSQLTDVRAALNTARAEHADVMKNGAELQAAHKQAEAELRSLKARQELLVNGGSYGNKNAESQEASLLGSGYMVCAVAAGVVEMIGITPGGLAEENGHVMTLVQPDQVRFRARGLQSDLGRLRDGLPASIAPPQGGSLVNEAALKGDLRIGLAADADERTVDLIVNPTSLASWAKAGVSAQLEVVLAGGSEELAIPQSAVVRDGARAIIFRRDPANPEKAIRMEADLGISDGRWVVIASGVREGDEIVLGGNFQLMLATSGTSEKAGHFHSDGTFHEGND